MGVLYDDKDNIVQQSEQSNNYYFEGTLFQILEHLYLHKETPPIIKLVLNIIWKKCRV